MTLTPQGVGFTLLVGCRAVEGLKNGLSGIVRAFFMCAIRLRGEDEIR